MRGRCASSIRGRSSTTITTRWSTPGPWRPSTPSFPATSACRRSSGPPRRATRDMSLGSDLRRRENDFVVKCEGRAAAGAAGAANLPGPEGQANSGAPRSNGGIAPPGTRGLPRRLLPAAARRSHFTTKSFSRFRSDPRHESRVALLALEVVRPHDVRDFDREPLIPPLAPEPLRLAVAGVLRPGAHRLLRFPADDRQALAVVRPVVLELDEAGHGPGPRHHVFGHRRVVGARRLRQARAEERDHHGGFLARAPPDFEGRLATLVDDARLYP